MNRVVITGMGWITPMGHDVESVWRRLLAGESGIERTTLFDASTFPTNFSAEIKNFRLADHIPDVRWHMFERSSHMPHVEEEELYLRVVGTFLDSTD